MNDNSNNQNRSPNNQRRHHHKRRHNHNRPPSEQGAQANGQAPAGNSGNQAQGQGQNNNRRRFHKHHHNRPRPNAGQPGQPGQPQQNPSINLDRIYEKYLNLLDQHLIARRKYHDLFYRAEGAQKAKLEKNFFHSLNELNEFKDKLAPSARELFEKRNNGLSLDLTYTTNHELPAEAQAVSAEGDWEDPHYLQSQKNADYSSDTEESAGTMDDYLRYKSQH
jgi:hypothetical protein